MVRKRAIASISLLVCSAVLQADQHRPSLELFHWWVSDGEQDALDVIRDHVEAQEYFLRDTALVDNDKVAYRLELTQRINSGRAPMAAQVIGYDVQSLAAEGRLSVLDSIARREQWDEVVPFAVQRLSKYQGHWVAVPINIHSTNWIWLNHEVMQRIGVQAPDTWDDLLSVLEQAKIAGVIPLAMGDAASQHMLLFESVAAGAGGVDFYRRVFMDLQLTSQDVGTLKEVFARMSALREYIGPLENSLSWSQGNSLVRSGRALMQVQGSWVVGEFRHYGLVPSQDYMCSRFPDTQGMVLFNSDQIVLFDDAADVATQDKFASILMSVAMQHDINIVTGSAPARVDIPMTGYSLCGQQGIRDVRAGNMRRTLLESIAMSGANPNSPKHALYPVVTAHLRGEITDQQALVSLLDAIRGAYVQSSMRTE